MAGAATVSFLSLHRPSPTAPTAAADLWEDDGDEPAGDVTPVGDSVEVLTELVSDPARAAVVAERLEALEAKVAAAVIRSRAPATLRAYRSDWKDFAVFCDQLGVDALPAAPAVVAGYVAELADPPDDRKPARVSTITRRLAAIGEGHKVAGHPNPCTDPLVRETMKGVRRALGVAPNQKKGITTGDIKAAVAALPPGLAGHRDRLLLTLGFAGGFRRSELAGITVTDVEQVAEGLLVHLDRSTTDQEGKGRRVEIVYGTDSATCPVRAWRTWLTTTGITSGPVFRRIDRHDRLLGPLSPQGVAIVVKRHGPPRTHQRRLCRPQPPPRPRHHRSPQRRQRTDHHAHHRPHLHPDVTGSTGRVPGSGLAVLTDVGLTPDASSR